MRSSKRSKSEQKRLDRAQGYAERMEQRMEQRVEPRKQQAEELSAPKKVVQRKTVKLDPPSEVAYKASFAATRELLPGGYTVALNATHLGPGHYAGTTVDTHQKKINIRYDPFDVDKVGQDRDTQVGTLAETFTHELALHGRNAQNQSITQESEHRGMFEKAGRKEFLRASRQTFKELENKAQKRAFVAHWYKDISSHIYGEKLEKLEKRPEQKPERRDFSEPRGWARARRDSMLDAIDNPREHAWTDK